MAYAFFGSIWSFVKFIWSSIIVVLIVLVSVAFASDDSYRRQLVKTAEIVLSWMISHPWSLVALLIFVVITPVSGLLAWAAKRRDEEIKEAKRNKQVYFVRPC